MLLKIKNTGSRKVRPPVYDEFQSTRNMGRLGHQQRVLIRLQQCIASGDQGAQADVIRQYRVMLEPGIAEVGNNDRVRIFRPSVGVAPGGAVRAVPVIGILSGVVISSACPDIVKSYHAPGLWRFQLL